MQRISSEDLIFVLHVILAKNRTNSGNAFISETGDVRLNPEVVKLDAKLPKANKLFALRHFFEKSSAARRNNPKMGPTNLLHTWA